MKEALFAGVVMLTSGGTLELLTSMETPPDVFTAAWLSVAFAVRMYVPAGTLLHTNVWGLVRSSPSFVVPVKNSTLLTVPSLSVAFALMVTVFPVVKVALLTGLVMLTEGAAFAALTVMVTAADVLMPALLSIALAVM